MSDSESRSTRYLDGKELLLTRRSIRTYTDQAISDETLWNLFELCRYAPTSRNSQSYYFVVIRNRQKMEWLAGLRGVNTAPIARAWTAVAVCADPEKSARHVQDGCIAAYHLLLAAHLLGLGTCWIAAMDRDDVKDALSVPRGHYIATITPLGCPAESPRAPERRPSAEMVVFRDA